MHGQPSVRPITVDSAAEPSTMPSTAPTSSGSNVSGGMESNSSAGRQRITAGRVIQGKEEQGKHDVFLSHNSKDKAAVEEIAEGLLKVGIRPWLDKWDLIPGETILDALERAIESNQCGALFFGPADVGKWHILEIRAYVEKWANKKGRLIPVILPDVESKPQLPMWIRQTLWVDMRNWTQKGDDGLYRLVCGIVGRPPGDSPRTRFTTRDVWEWQKAIE